VAASATAEAAFVRGVADDGQHAPEQAIADYSQALTLDPDFVDAYVGRGLAYYHEGDLERAVADYTEALRLQPHDATIACSRGLAYRDLNQREQAILDLQACRDGSDDPVIRQGATQQLRALGVDS
jgi:tetratricopeptide (TPR) repeat protein